jgi:transcriptional regulator with XRE-family HTH domain
VSPRQLGATIRGRREASGLTQEQLAERAGVTRAYLAKLETGGKRNPSLVILRQLAGALGIPSGDLVEPRVVSAEAAAIRFEMKPTEVFDESDPLTIPLLRLMAATNDVLQLQKLLLGREDRLKARNRSELLINEGEILYLTRMLWGHLYEAGLAFRGLDQADRSGVTELVSGDPEGSQALAHLRRVYADPSMQWFNRNVLNQVRTFAAFHYKEETFRERLRARKRDVGLVLAQYTGLSRYSVTDDLLKDFVIEKAGGSSAKFMEAFRRALDLAKALDAFVRVLVARLLEQKSSDVVENRETLRVPAMLRRPSRQRRRRR